LKEFNFLAFFQPLDIIKNFNRVGRKKKNSLYEAINKTQAQNKNLSSFKTLFMPFMNLKNNKISKIKSTQNIKKNLLLTKKICN
jgi:hypothetical protein